MVSHFQKPSKVHCIIQRLKSTSIAICEDLMEKLLENRKIIPENKTDKISKADLWHECGKIE